jgi:sugar lactone lactonase YvrE
MTEIACAVDARNLLGECCLWCPVSRRVWWIDIQKPCLQSYDPASREHGVYPLPGRFCGCIALRKSGGLVLALDNGLHGFDPATGKLEFLLQGEHVPGNRWNDGRCDRQGRLWIGTLDIKLERPSGSFYRIGADRSVQQLFGDVTIPNSIAFSPDDRTLYFADTRKHTIWAFDFDIAAGAISNRRVFAETGQAHPDGSCVDADGFLWNAEYGGGRITRYAPDGCVDRRIDLPVTNPTCCCFGGDRLDTLYISSARPPDAQNPRELDGALLSLNAGVRGLPEAAFAG